MTGYITEFAASLDLMIAIVERHGKGEVMPRAEGARQYDEEVRKHGSVVKAATALRAERGEGPMGEKL